MGVMWTTKEIFLAREHARQGWGPARITEALGGRHDPEDVRRLVEKERKKYEARRKEQRKLYICNTKEVIGMERPIDIPDAVWEERDRRICAPVRDLTASIFGDPPVGFSALDRARA